MAAASHLNVTPSERKASLGIAKPFSWPSHSIAMHVTRPKSAKGRTRSSLNFSHNVEAYSCRIPSSPQPLAPCEEAASGRRASSSQQLHQPIQVLSPEVPDLLQQMPTRTSSSLNKYRVLPSINRKELRKNVVQSGQPAVSPWLEEEEQSFKDLQLGKGPIRVMTKHPGGSGEYPNIAPRLLEPKSLSEMRERTSPSVAATWEEPTEEEPRLLLAIRSPAGQRFEQHFRPTDSLETVLAVAEQRNLATYQRCSIETVEVPRRTFSDLTKSLQDCAIPHKSVLCILQEERERAL